jgi:hypothetical protein
MHTRILVFNKDQAAALPSTSSSVQEFITEATEKSHGSTPLDSPSSSGQSGKKAEVVCGHECSVQIYSSLITKINIIGNFLFPTHCYKFIY